MNQSEESGYRPLFQQWDNRSWVRSKPRRTGAFASELHYFSPDLCPLFAHPEVRAAPEQVREEILVHSLYVYLEFTVQLELGPVNETCLMLHRPDFCPWLSAEMKEDLLRIYTDEAAHAEMSHTLLATVRDHTGVEPIPHRPFFLQELSRLYATELPVYRPLVKLFFSIVSETLITGSLTKLPKDPSVQRVVRELAADHAMDEGLHHAYFRRLFKSLWPKMPAPLRTKIGVVLPEIILAFLRPDEAAMTHMLAGHPDVFEDPARVVTETVELPRVRQGVVDNATPTLRMLAQEGAFSDPAISAAFDKHGLRRSA
ncbi:diiron oxygenase [Streptomyces sp. NPDC021093]|uniref:diiron oxygenase n=1 Tax=Streptomyces sp. NPDC021093 TaxID=3365112 RepID=UPI00379DC93C